MPTWAPALAVGLGGDTSWRASRGKGKCDDTRRRPRRSTSNQLAQYYCLYRTARLTYSATLIPDPVKPPAARSSARRLGRAGAGVLRRRSSLKPPVLAGRAAGVRPAPVPPVAGAARAVPVAPVPPVPRRCRASAPVARARAGRTPTSSCAAGRARSSAGGGRCRSCVRRGGRVVEVVPVEPCREASAPAGTVRSGVDLGTVVATLPPPQPAEAERGGDEQRARRGTTVMRRRIGGASDAAAQDASGAMRRPQVGQSLRSFCASWSHQLQKRRFSTAHGSRDARGREREHLADDLELLAGVAVAVDAVRARPRG